MTKTLTAALVGAATLFALSLPVNAQAQRPYDPSAGSVGFKQGTQTAQRKEDPSAGSVGFKATKKAKKKKGKKKSKGM
jgi:hypothetical protein